LAEAGPSDQLDTDPIIFEIGPEMLAKEFSSSIVVSSCFQCFKLQCLSSHTELFDQGCIHGVKNVCLCFDEYLDVSETVPPSSRLLFQTITAKNGARTAPVIVAKGKQLGVFFYKYFPFRYQ
jgi:hypothetical protein